MLDLLAPVARGTETVGYLRTGFALRQFEERLGTVARPVGLILVAVIVLGLVSSQIITISILQPLGRLEAAVDELSRQNWKTPIPVRGRDELTRLATAFNQMAHTLNERESRLSQGNRDLFVLHTAGLDLMESLDLAPLLAKIAERAEDLVRADTVTLTAVDPHTRQLHYLHARGIQAQALQERPLPVEAGGIFNWIASYGTPLLIQDASADFRLDGPVMQKHGVRSLMAVPLWSSNSLRAVLTVLDKKGGDAFDRRDLRIFTVFANIAAAALQNASLYADLKTKMYELEQTQLQLVHSTKLAAIGELATNLAHEINNPLTSVLGYTSHLLKTLPLPDESRRKLQLMEQETLRVRKIIRNLLDFSRQRHSRMEAGDIAVPLREIVALLQGVAERSSVRFDVNYPATPVIVSMDQNELKQVFINIMNNALHAMPGGGDLQVRIASISGEAHVSFADTGQGIAADHLNKVFEPFFTTKQNENGTGLGLSISYRIVQNHGGRIEVGSEPRRGSVFTVVLPLAEHAPATLAREEG
jgi:signal transduction histidine kinase